MCIEICFMSTLPSAIQDSQNTAGDSELEEIIHSLSSSPEFTTEERDFFAEWIDVKRFDKGVFLLKERQRIDTSYYVYKGCVREFYLKDGEEKTVAFYTTGDAITDTGSRLNQLCSTVNWECVSECIVSVYPIEVEKEVYRRFPRLESMCRIETEKLYSKYKNAINHYLSSSPVERYENLLQTRPELFQLVPLYHIASYLGVKPESLSRIRNRLRSA